MSSTEFIKISSLRKKYDNGFEALKGIDLDIKEGEFLVVVGPSGCGKSTLLRLIAGLEEIKQGEIKIDGKVVNELSPTKRDIAMVFQSYALYPHLSVFENIATPLNMKNLTNFQKMPLVGRFIGDFKKRQKDIKQQVLDTCKMLDIEHLVDKKPSLLSGGQRQRVAIGRAMVRNPKVFLMDEPLSNLDAKLRVQTRAEIAQLHRRLKSTFIYVTHDQSEAMTLGDRIVMMHEGKILQIDTAHGIYKNPKHLLVAEFIGSPKINTFDGSTDENGSIVLFDIPLRVKCQYSKNQKVTVAIRPEALKIADELDEIRWESVVYHKEYLGAFILLYVEIKAKAKAVVRVGVGKDFDPDIDETFFVKPKLKHLLVFDNLGKRVECNKIELKEET